MRLPERPDAAPCLHDRLVLTAVRALHADGRPVFEDLDVVGFDDIEATRFSIPALTTVAPDKRGVARRAVKSLPDRIDAGGPGGPAVDETAGHRPIAREGSGGRGRPGRSGRRPARGRGPASVDGAGPPGRHFPGRPRRRPSKAVRSGEARGPFPARPRSRLVSVAERRV
ncbi:substrate-binding domain-containing protein [Streptomyces heliomycini]|uniref:Substrate-binding domain-containing protein n=1 Tax=Streptomyces heliomycini TaxID=284032 RepID=A0ABV5LGV8_9ACTN|nr:substrate-binding domain-containing protein [Streptomyces sp. XY152]